MMGNTTECFKSVITVILGVRRGGRGGEKGTKADAAVGRGGGWRGGTANQAGGRVNKQIRARVKLEEADMEKLIDESREDSE